MIENKDKLEHWHQLFFQQLEWFSFLVNKKKIKDDKLSLYLCKGIIESHGGKITVKNNIEKGCTFTITLPIKK